MATTRNEEPHTYKVIEIVGTASEGSDAAIRNAVQTAGRTLENLDWYEVVSQRGHIMDGAVAHFQVTLKLGFRLHSKREDASPSS